MQPKISVIIPVHNTANYLKQCLDSVCSQTLEELEIICINDGSTDCSGEIFHDYSQRDTRIKIISFEKNRGVSAARNAGIDAATGKYIGFVDSDDRIIPDFYRMLYEHSGDDIDIIKGETRYFVKETILQDSFVDYFDNNQKIMGNKGYFYYYFFCAIYRRDFISQYHIRFFEDLCYSEDLCFATSAARHCDSLVCVDGAIYYYVLNSASATHTVKDKRFLYLRSFVLSIDRMLNTANATSLDMQVYCAQLCRILVHLKLSFNDKLLDSEIVKQWEEYIIKNAKYPDTISRMVQEDLFGYYGASRKYIFQQLRSSIQEKKNLNT